MADEGSVFLRTQRLSLRRFCDRDGEAFAAYRSDPEIARYQGWDAPYPIVQARRFVQEMATAEADVPGEWFQIAIALRRDDSLIGDCAFVSLLGEPRTVEIGFTLSREHQGQGYAREAILALLTHLFGPLGKHRVTASCDPRNVRSVRLLKAVGMRQEGHLVESTWSAGEWSDDLLFAVLGRERHA